MFVFVSVRSRDQCRSFFTYLFQYALSFLLSFASSESVRSHLTDDGYMDKFVWVFFLLSVDLIFVKKKKTWQKSFPNREGLDTFLGRQLWRIFYLKKLGDPDDISTGLRFCWKGGWKKWNILSPKWWFNMLESKKITPKNQIQVVGQPNCQTVLGACTSLQQAFCELRLGAYPILY